MSGIAGIYYLDGRPVERTDVERMVDSIAHRGPDGSGVWTDGSVGLGHRMLWTTPESLHEKLPLTNKTGDLTITADARIDNRDELIPTLNLNGRPHETIADSEIILAAYEKWGEQCPEKLLGDFSFAIWDKRNQKIYCARDPIGIKPFYYYFKEGKFRWSSEPKAIFEDKTISKKPNLQLICLYLLNRFDEREETLYKDVYRLPPSHSMTIENGRIRKDQYWDIDPNYSIRYKTDEEYAEHFLNLFKDAVKVRLRSHGPVGALLSGGLDSSSIVCTAQLLYKEGVVPNNGFETFSIIFDTFPCDERSYIKQVVQKWDMKANYFNYEEYLSWVDFEKSYEYPDASYFPTLLSYGPLLKNTTKKGINVMLNGIGGDDLLSGDIGHLIDLMLGGNISELITLIRYYSALRLSSPYLFFFNSCIHPLIPWQAKVLIRTFLEFFRLKGNKIPPWINNFFLKKNKVIQRMRSRPNSIKFKTHFQRGTYELLRRGWNTNIALDLLDRFAYNYGIENRYPFFDKRLVIFSFSLPHEQLCRKEWRKVILRKAMEGILPEPVRKRKDKAEFSSTIESELKNRQVNKVKQIVQGSNLSAFGIIKTDQFQQSFIDFLQKNTTSDIRNVFEIFLWLELWSRSMMGMIIKGGEDYETKKDSRSEIWEEPGQNSKEMLFQAAN